MKILKVLIISLMLASTLSVSARDLGNKSGSGKSFFNNAGFLVGVSIALGVGFGIGGHELYKRYWKRTDNAQSDAQAMPAQQAEQPKKRAKRSLGRVASGIA